MFYLFFEKSMSDVVVTFLLLCIYSVKLSHDKYRKKESGTLANEMVYSTGLILTF